MVEKVFKPKGKSAEFGQNVAYRLGSGDARLVAVGGSSRRVIRTPELGT